MNQFRMGLRKKLTKVDGEKRRDEGMKKNYERFSSE